MSIQRIAPILILLGLLLQGCESKVKDLSALDVIPQDAAIVVEIHKLNRATEMMENSTILEQALSIPSVQEFKNLTSNLFDAVGVEANNMKSGIYAYAHLSGAEKYNWVLCAPVKKLKNFNGLQFGEAWELTTRNYASGEIMTFTKGETEIFAINHLGVVAASLNENLIEEIIRQAESGLSIQNNEIFIKHQDIATSSDPLTVYVNFSEIAGVSKTILQHSKPDWLKNFGTWVELDISEEDGDLILNGASINPDSAHAFLSCFNDVGSVSFSAPEIIPSNTVGVVMMGTKNFMAYQTNQDKFLKHWNNYRSIKKKRDAIGIDLRMEFYPHIDGEFGVIYTETKTSVAEGKMAYLKMKEPEAAFEMLSNLSGDAIENYREHFIYRLEREKLLPATLGRAFKSLNKPYFTLHGDYVVFSNNLVNLKSAVNDYIAGKTWSNSNGFNSAASHFSSSGNIWVLAKNPGAYDLSMMFMEEQEAKKAKKHKKVFEEADWAGIQITNKGEANILSAFIGKQAEAAAEANQVWALQLEAPVLGKPQFIYNHSTQQNDILVQDENHKLYWINYKSEILWSAQLDGAILGKVNQVDLFQNKKLQLAFTTTEKFYIIDRLGNAVAPFPIAIGGITAPLAVFDYDKSRNYRFLVCANNKVYNYNKEGKVVTGWQFTQTKSAVSVTPKHYVLGGKDYIFVAETNGKINVLNRRGDSRIELNKPFVVSDEIYLQLGNSMAESRLISIDKEENITYLFLNDKLDQLEVDADESLQHLKYDGNNMLLTAGTNLINRHQDFPFNHEFEEGILFQPGLYKHKGNTFFNATIEKDEVHVLDQKGNEVLGFPVYGSSDATLGRFNTSGNLYLVCGSNDGTLYLYRIQQ